MSQCGPRRAVPSQSSARAWAYLPAPWGAEETQSGPCTRTHMHTHAHSHSRTRTGCAHCRPQCYQSPELGVWGRVSPVALDSLWVHVRGTQPPGPPACDWSPSRPWKTPSFPPKSPGLCSAWDRPPGHRGGTKGGYLPSVPQDRQSTHGHPPAPRGKWGEGASPTYPSYSSAASSVSDMASAVPPEREDVSVGARLPQLSPWSGQAGAWPGPSGCDWEHGRSYDRGHGGTEVPEGAASSPVLSPWVGSGVRGPQALPPTPAWAPREPPNRGQGCCSRNLYPCRCPASRQLRASGSGVQHVRKQCGAFSCSWGPAQLPQIAHQPPEGAGGHSYKGAAWPVARDRTHEGAGTG